MRSFSPLRYPGGKGQVYKYVVHLLEHNDLLGCTYIEPFAGGAGVAFRLLFDEKVRKIILNDVDRSIYSVWYAILYENDNFVDRIQNAEFTIDEWYKQKNIQKNKESAELIDLAFSTFYLNRTNRSGIIKAGVIGGINQDGNYKMDCRFNKEKLIELVNKIHQYRHNIDIYNLDVIDFMEIVKRKKNKFYFIDPPYYEKGHELYTNFFTHQDHQSLSKYLIKKLRRNQFLISYDNHCEIRDMYRKLPMIERELTYSVGSKRKAKEIFIGTVV